MTERTTVRLPPELLARAKRKAVVEGRTLTALIEEGLRVVIAGPGKPEKSKRVVLPRISKAIGGLLPGVDLTRLSDLQAIEDRDYLKRVKPFK